MPGRIAKHGCARGLTMVTQKAKRKDSAVPDTARGPRVLVVEDEPDLQELLRYNLQRDGFHVTVANNGEQGLRLAQSDPPDLLLLDLMLPGIDGLNVCRTLKSDPRTASIPIVMLTAKGEEADIVVGLELGADDYVTKPFSPRVLLARLNAVLRRRQTSGAGESDQDQVIRHNDLLLDPQKHEVTLDGTILDLTVTEFKLLRLFVGKPGRVFTRQQIIDAIHGQHVAVTDRSVDVQVVNLRRKLGRMGPDIQTVRGVGYKFKE